ncbi:MAG: hypothetical protein ABI435_05220, partial [Pseudolysinimonas sp.]
MSNDDGDDGLAALFGGVTPQKAPRPDDDVRPASEPVVQPFVQPVVQPAYPGLEAAAQVTPPADPAYSQFAAPSQSAP